jgi:U3 small nucleolar RNA-associated protein 25
MHARLMNCQTLMCIKKQRILNRMFEYFTYPTTLWMNISIVVIYCHNMDFQLMIFKSQNSELGVVSWMTTPISNSSSNDWSPVTDIKQLNEHHIREPLASLWHSHNNHAAANEDSFSYLQCQLFNILNSYKDLFYSNCSITNEAEIRSVCMLHALNHVIKNRSRVRKNNTRLSLAAKEGRDLGEIRDQGITRPKVLILVPFRDSALKLVQAMIQLLVKPGKGEVANKKKFFKLFGQDESNDSKLPEYKPGQLMRFEKAVYSQ